jgi:hypothetical protein
MFVVLPKREHEHLRARLPRLSMPGVSSVLASDSVRNDVRPELRLAQRRDLRAAVGRQEIASADLVRDENL